MSVRGNPSGLRAWVERAFGNERRPITVRLDEWATPDASDDLGLLRVGKLLEWMDVLGPLAASRHCQSSVTTAAVDRLTMRQPIRMGQHVRLLATVGYTSLRSVGVALAIDAEGTPAATGWMTFVAIRDGRVQPVPQIRPRRVAERTPFREGRLRHEQHRRNDARPAIPAWDELTSRTSFVHKIEPVRGTLSSGTLMRWIEAAAHLSARVHVGASVGFEKLLGLAFLEPVRPHVFVHIRSLAVRVEKRAVDVFVHAQSEDPASRARCDAACAFARYSPLGGEAIPLLECTTDAEQILREHAVSRAAFERSLR